MKVLCGKFVVETEPLPEVKKHEQARAKEALWENKARQIVPARDMKSSPPINPLADKLASLTQ